MESLPLHQHLLGLELWGLEGTGATGVLAGLALPWVEAAAQRCSRWIEESFASLLLVFKI